MSSSPLLTKVFRDRLGTWKEPVWQPETLAKYSENKNIPLVTSGSLAGIEFEIENCRENNIPEDLPREFNQVFNSLWSVTQDGSLRNNGLEFITKPLSGQNLTFALQMLENYTKKVYPECEATSRCGIHVHINALDINTAQLFAWVSLYQIFEKQLYRISGGRDKNLFCLPTWAWDGNIKQAIQYFGIREDDGVTAAHQLSSIGLKYAGMNTRTLSEHGTLEFRQMQTTKDMAKIAQWADLLIRVKLFATKSVEDIPSLVKFWNMLSELNTNSSYYLLMSNVFGDARPLMEMPKYDADMAAGVIQVKESLVMYHKSIKANKDKPQPAQVFAQPPPARRQGPSRQDYLRAITDTERQIRNLNQVVTEELAGQNRRDTLAFLRNRIAGERERITTWQRIVNEVDNEVQPAA